MKIKPPQFLREVETAGLFLSLCFLVFFECRGWNRMVLFPFLFALISVKSRHEDGHKGREIVEEGVGQIG